jgi:hypothetical protein
MLEVSLTSDLLLQLVLALLLGKFPETDGSRPETFVDVVGQRFQIFGGVARECLSTSEQFVKKQQDKLRRSSRC